MTISAATSRKCGLSGSEDGATAAEAALVLAMFIVTVLFIIDFAQAFFIWNTLQLVVGQTSRDVIVQNGMPGASCDAVCAEAALQTVILADLGAAASICAAPTQAGQYCVNATCNPSSCSSTTSTPATMTLSALYGFKFLGTYTLTGQITIPIVPPH